MKKSLNIIDQIKVVKPCQENITNMTENNHGFDCSLCNEQVYDSTKLTRFQILILRFRSKKTPCMKISRDKSGKMITKQSFLSKYCKRLVMVCSTFFLKTLPVAAESSDINDIFIGQTVFPEFIEAVKNSVPKIIVFILIGILASIVVWKLSSKGQKEKEKQDRS